MKSQCCVKGCIRLRHGRNVFCKMHYERNARLGSPGDARQRTNKGPRGRCNHVGCNQLEKARGLCHKHYTACWMSRGNLKKPCKAIGCNRGSVALGLCQKHYQNDRNKHFKRLQESALGKETSHTDLSIAFKNVLQRSLK